jgi:hypothetical protein
MPNQGQRKKRGGRNKSKKMQAMRASVQRRQETASPPRPSTDAGDWVEYKRGTEQDRTSKARRDQR